MAIGFHHGFELGRSQHHTFPNIHKPFIFVSTGRGFGWGSGQSGTLNDFVMNNRVKYDFLGLRCTNIFFQPTLRKIAGMGDIGTMREVSMGQMGWISIDLSAFHGTIGLHPFSDHSRVIVFRVVGNVNLRVQQDISVLALWHLSERANSSQPITNRTLMTELLIDGTINMTSFLSDIQVIFSKSLLFDGGKIIDSDIFHRIVMTAQNKFNYLLPKYYCLFNQAFLFHMFIVINQIKKKKMYLSQCLSIPEMFQKDQVQLEKNRTEPELFRDEIDGNGDRGEGSYQGIKEYGSVVSKKIKIKTIHHRTEVDQEPMERTNHRLKTSPVKNSPLKKSNLNYSQIATEGYKKIKVRRGNYQYPQKSIENKQNYSYSESMYHQSRKTSLNYSQDKKSSLLLSVSQKDEDRISSKSKKKVEFTVYEEKRKSNSKSIDKNKEKSLKKHLSSLYSVPYPCTRNIVIDLFDQKAKLSRPKSRSKDRSISREHNRSSKFQLNKSVNKSQQSLINEQKIQGTLEKLSKFQIFNDYKDKLQIENMLQAFHLAGEHECKWVLLVIDQIFSKMRSASKV